MNSIVSESAKPIKIPPIYFQYAENHDIYKLTQQLLKVLILERPKDPLSYLIDYLEKDIKEVPSIFVFGPPSSGKRTLAELIVAKLNCVYITENDVYGLSSNGRDSDPRTLALALKERLKNPDCIEKGFILSGFPSNELQAKALGWEGIYPEYAVFLKAPEEVILEREQSKRLDPETGIQYHLLMDPPPDATVGKRLIPVPGCTSEAISKAFRDYEFESVLLQQFYSPVAKIFNADQHLTDIYSSVLAFVTQPRRSIGFRTPRVLLLGFAGSGRKTQAKHLACKYGLIVVNCGELLKKELDNCTTSGKAVKSYLDRKVPVPDDIVVDVIKRRLVQDDCSTRGWVLIGYPRTKAQAELLDSVGLSPNRVFILHIPHACAAERLTGRRVDSVTGIRFHVAYKPNPGSVSDRILQNPDDEECVIGSKLARFAAHREELEEYYSAKLVHIHAAINPRTVFEEIEAGLVNPLPRT